MDQPVVTVKNGKLRGKIGKNYDGENYYSFQGIPYAKPPIGSLRFKAPAPAEPWEGIRDATKDGDDCAVKNVYFPVMIGSEDCLYLNVHTRELLQKSKTLQPVMVWFHAGAFIVGNGNTESHGPEFLMTKNVVVVTLNYRIGLLGFLSFDDPSIEVPGNAGLKDQVMALKWVHKNISQFGGDPDNVTLFGMSAGAASVHYLMLSPLTKGLFNKCILQSGSALCSWAQGHKSMPYLTEALEIKTSNERKVFEILENMPLEELLKLQDKIPDNLGCFCKRCCAPVIEYKSSSAFITEKPEEIIKSGNYHQVPFIIGYTSREGIVSDFYSDEAKCGCVIKDFESKIPFTFNLTKGSELSKKVASNIQRFYYGEQSPCQENENQFYLLEGDTTFVWPIISAVKRHSAVSTKPIYLYRVSIETILNYNKQNSGLKHNGVAHGDDFGYIYKSSSSIPIIPNSLEEITMKRFVTMWTNFAISGKPDYPDKAPLLKIQWKPIDKHDLHYLEVGENLTVGVNPDDERMKFWDKLSSLKMK